MLRKIARRVKLVTLDFILNPITLDVSEKLLYWLLEKAPHITAINIYALVKNLGILRIWDPWILRDGSEYKLFFLAGPKFKKPFWIKGIILSATSSDFEEWTFQGLALKPDECEWSNGRMLAGSCYKENDNFYLFYSSSPKPPNLFLESISIAMSKDCLDWQKYSTPLLTSDNKFYGSSKATISLEEQQRFSPNGLHQQFRDPYIFKCNVTNQYLLIFSAASANGHPFFRGCIGQATSRSIEGPYTLLEPLLYPVTEDNEGIFYEVERTQIIFKHNKYYLFFSSWVSSINANWVSNYKEFDLSHSSVYCYVADTLERPFIPLGIPIVPGSGRTGLYGTNFLQDEEGNWFAYGWYPENFTFEVSRKFRVIWDGEIPKILVPDKD